MELNLILDNGNAKTNFIEDHKSSKYFWNYCYSPTYLIGKEKIQFESNVDLMGNPLGKPTPLKFKKKSKQ